MIERHGLKKAASEIPLSFNSTHAGQPMNLSGLSDCRFYIDHSRLPEVVNVLGDPPAIEKLSHMVARLVIAADENG